MSNPVLKKDVPLSLYRRFDCWDTWWQWPHGWQEVVMHRWQQTDLHLKKKLGGLDRGKHFVNFQNLYEEIMNEKKVWPWSKCKLNYVYFWQTFSVLIHMLKCVQRSLVTSKQPCFRQQANGQYWTQAMLTGSWTDYLMLEYTNSGKSLEQNVAECEPCTGPRDNPVSSSNHAGICSTKDTSSTQSHDL